MYVAFSSSASGSEDLSARPVVAVFVDAVDAHVQCPGPLRVFYTTDLVARILACAPRVHLGGLAVVCRSAHPLREFVLLGSGS
jgi:Ni,Fe-hydrogenase maturation factor